MVAHTALRDRQAFGLAASKRAAVAPAAGSARVITIASGKGGVGKTNVAVNLAIALGRRRRRVLIFDGDLGLANVDIMLGLRVERTLRDVVTGRCGLQDIIVDGPPGTKVVPGGGGLSELVHLDGFGRGRLLRQLAEVESSFDVVLVDAAAGVGEDVLHFVRSVGEVLVVTTPEPTALTDAYALIKVTSAEAGAARFGLVVNAARGQREGDDAANRLQQVVARFLDISVPVLGVLPFCEEVAAAVREQQPVMLGYPGCAFARSIDQLCTKLLGDQGAGQPAERIGLTQVVQGFLQRLTSAGRLSTQRQR